MLAIYISKPYVVVPVIRCRDLILQYEMSTIFSIAHFSSLGDQFAQASQCIGLTFGIPFIKDKHRDVVHLSPPNTEGGKNVEAILCTNSLAQVELLFCILTTNR